MATSPLPIWVGKCKLPPHFVINYPPKLFILPLHKAVHYPHYMLFCPPGLVFNTPQNGDFYPP